MKKQEIKIFSYECLLVIILFFALFVPNIFSKTTLMILLILYTFGLFYWFKKQKANSLYQKQVTILMILFALLYIGIIYLSGLYFGFIKSKIFFSIASSLYKIVSLTIIIILSEIIRKYFLSNDIIIHIKRKMYNISAILSYISMVILDLVIYLENYDLSKLNDFFAALGFVFFASLSCNLLYQYISTRYNEKGIIFYRLIIILYMYIIPVIPDTYIFFQSFVRMCFPYIIYLMIEKLYSNNEKITSCMEKSHSLIGNSILFISMILFIMFVSCQFQFGILVIGSRSMTGTINKGDAVVFEKYKNQSIPIGQVIIFDKNELKTVHRVIDIKNVNGQKRYYTKGDANKNTDENYITDTDIYGIVLYKIKYIGYPTLWVREIFES